MSEQSKEISGGWRQRIRWRRLAQFSLRTLLILMTLAAVGCWWFLRPKVREEYLGLSGMRIQREIRLKEINVQSYAPLDLNAEVFVEGGRSFAITNDGRWRLFDRSKHLLVSGRYRNGKLEGKWMTYHKNGRKAVEGAFAEGEKVGVWRTWDEEGRLLEEVGFGEREREDSRE